MTDKIDTAAMRRLAEAATPEPLTDDERAEAMAHDALIYELSVVLMRLDGNDGDPHQLLWCGGTVPEPWGDAWHRYEPQAEAVLNAIGDDSARAMVDALRSRAHAVSGWKLVPVEPTPEMLQAGEETFQPTYTGTCVSDPRSVWSAMFAAAPAALQQHQPGEVPGTKE